MKRFLLLIGMCSGFSGMCQVIYPYRVCTSPAALREFSGLALAGPNLLAAVNDGGNSPTIYFMDTTGKQVRTRTFTSISNTDWEELLAHGQQLYIADVGDNLCQRKKLNLFRYDLSSDTIGAKIQFGFAEKKVPLAEKDRHYDCEAGFFAGEKIYLFSKTHAKPYTGKCIQYTIDANENNREYSGSDSTYWGNKGFIYHSLTGAAISPSQELVAFISCTRLWVKHSPRPGVYLSTGWTMEFVFEGLTQKEAVTFLSDDRLVVADEKTAGIMGGRMYFYEIGAYFNGKKRYARPSVKNAVLRKEKENAFSFHFESTDPLPTLSLVLADEKGKVLHVQEVRYTGPAVDAEIRFDAGENKKPVAFWVVSENKILFTAKITGL